MKGRVLAEVLAIALIALCCFVFNFDVFLHAEQGVSSMEGLEGCAKLSMFCFNPDYKRFVLFFKGFLLKNNLVVSQTIP